MPRFNTASMSRSPVHTDAGSMLFEDLVSRLKPECWSRGADAGDVQAREPDAAAPLRDWKEVLRLFKASNRRPVVFHSSL